MSRTTLCLITAGALTVLSVGVMITRHQVLGHEVQTLSGPGVWKVTLSVQGVAVGDPRVITTAPLELGRQHVVCEDFDSAALQHRVSENNSSERRQVYWTKRPTTKEGPFRLRCTYQVALESPHAHPTTPLARSLYAPPLPGQYLDVEQRTEDYTRIADQARDLTDGQQTRADQAEALYRFVAQEIKNEPRLGLVDPGPLECLESRGGTSTAKSRLLVAMLRSRGIQARVVAGVALARGEGPRGHDWVEAWLRDRWLPMCPFHGHFGRVPATYLVFGHGSRPLVRGRNVRDLDWAFLVERPTATAAHPAEATVLQRFFRGCSLHALPPGEQHLVEFLLLLPVAALIICVYRNLIGLMSFGTFAPALIGLAFRDLHSLPGAAVFVMILLVGWVLRRALDRFHLLQVPRISLMLSLIVIVLILTIGFASYHDVPLTRYISLFPLIILTGMVERFWTREAEDGTAASFRTLVNTLLIAGTISVVLSFHTLVRLLFYFPELLGVIMALQLLIGRYTGYRLLELYRFRDFLEPPAQPSYHTTA